MAQMVRTHTLLLRQCHVRGYVMGQYLTPAALDSGPFLLPPARPMLFPGPVIGLDFTSL